MLAILLLSLIGRPAAAASSPDDGEDEEEENEAAAAVATLRPLLPLTERRALPFAPTTLRCLAPEDPGDGSIGRGRGRHGVAVGLVVERVFSERGRDRAGLSWRRTRRRLQTRALVVPRGRCFREERTDLLSLAAPRRAPRATPERARAW